MSLSLLAAASIGAPMEPLDQGLTLVLVAALLTAGFAYGRFKNLLSNWCVNIPAQWYWFEVAVRLDRLEREKKITLAKTVLAPIGIALIVVVVCLTMLAGRGRSIYSSPVLMPFHSIYLGLQASDE